MKKLMLLTALFAPLSGDAQEATWNFQDALTKSGEIDILAGDGATISTNINTVGVRALGRSAPVLVKSDGTVTSIGVVFDDYTSLADDGSGGYVYKTKPETLSEGYDVEPIANLILIGDRLAGFWSIITVFNSGRSCYGAESTTTPIIHPVDVKTDSKFQCGSTMQGYNPEMGNTRDLSGIAANFWWSGASYSYPGYTDFINYFYPTLNTPVYETYSAAGDLIYSEKITCGGWYKLNGYSTGSVYYAEDHSTCTYTMSNQVETYTGVGCIAEFNSANDSVYPPSCNHPSYGTRFQPQWDFYGMKIVHDFRYGATKNHYLFYTNHGSRIVAIDGAYSNIMPTELGYAIMNGGVGVSSFGGGTHVFVSGTSVYSFNDEDGSSVLLFTLPSSKKIIGNIRG